MVTTDYPIRFTDQLRQHLRALRKKRGLTQAQIGALIGVSQVRIAEIEANPGLVSFEQLMQLFTTLGVTIFLCEPQDTLRTMVAGDLSNAALRKAVEQLDGTNAMRKAVERLDGTNAMRKAVEQLDGTNAMRKAVERLDGTNAMRKAVDEFGGINELQKALLAHSKRGSW